MRSEGVIFEYSSIGEFRDLVQRHLSSFMASIIKDSSADSQADISDQNNSQVEMFRSQIEAFIRRFEAEWVAERDSEPHNIEDAKYIISSALDELINYRAQIVSDPENKLLPIFSEATKIMKTLCRHQLYLDGGKSFREFWEKGDAVIELLKRLPSVLAD